MVYIGCVLGSNTRRWFRRSQLSSEKKKKESYLKAEAFSFDYDIYVIALTSLLIEDLEAVNPRKYV